MAIEEHDREDLLRDGRAMPIRGELNSDDVELLIGFRPRNQASLYCGPDRVFQFDASGKIRRVFFDGRKFAADDGVLVEVKRESRGGRVELIRRQVDDQAHATIVSAADAAVRQTLLMIDGDQPSWRIIGATESEFRDHVGQWIQLVSDPPEIALSAGV